MRNVESLLITQTFSSQVSQNTSFPNIKSFQIFHNICPQQIRSRALNLKTHLYILSNFISCFIWYIQDLFSVPLPPLWHLNIGFRYLVIDVKWNGIDDICMKHERIERIVFIVGILYFLMEMVLQHLSSGRAMHTSGLRQVLLTNWNSIFHPAWSSGKTISHRSITIS